MEPFGFLVVDKPKGITSHDIVYRVRRGINLRRIGHAGTLDPMATGVLILCIGAATRLSEYVMESSKQYTATVRLGIETDTYDADGQIIATATSDHLTQADIENALTHFQGDVEQVPPMYSAIKQDGKKLYKLARAGKEVERAARSVSMQTTLVDLALPNLTLQVSCSAGTYIRSIAHDLGAMLDVGAHLTALRRDSSGAVADPVTWDTLQIAMADGTWQRFLRTESEMVTKIPPVHLDEQQSDYILHGRSIVLPDTYTVELLRAYSDQSRFIGILEWRVDQWWPLKVFLPTDL
jgi:tRNA pseudouridine55 synthase